jgi:uncharacterized protein YpmS
MKIHKFYLITFILITVFVLNSLACRLGADKTQKPAETITVSTQAVATLEQKLQDSVEQAGQGGTVEIILSEEEITSVIALRFSEQSGMTITDLQVYLREGKVQMFGNVLVGEVSVPVVVFFEPQVNSSGQLHLTLISFEMGPIEVPDKLKETIQEQVDQLMTDMIQQSGGTFFIESVTISDGNLTLRGYRP